MSLTGLWLSCGPRVALADSSVRSAGANLLIGDEALVAHFGRPPTMSLPPDQRTEIHLRYVLHRLRTREATHLPPGRRIARAAALDELERYIEAGRFPQNDDHPDPFRPTFVDRRGHICAVGHLYAASRGVSAAHRIAAQYKYAFVFEIEDSDLAAWARDAGLTVEELALIQPMYPPSWYDQQREVKLLPHSTMDRVDDQTHLTIGTALELGGREGTTLVQDFFVQFLPFFEETLGGPGFYLSTGFAAPIGYSQASEVAAANIDVGSVLVFDQLTWGKLILRAGGLIPTASAEPAAAVVSAQATAPRITDIALRLPRAAGARASVSPVLALPCDSLRAIGYPAHCIVRVDAGVDLISLDGGPARAIPRLNAAVGAQFPLGGFFIESATVYYDGPGDEGRFLSTLAATLRWRADRDLLVFLNWLEAGISAVVPVTHQPPGWALMLDLRVSFDRIRIGSPDDLEARYR
ncbi:MAG: hypothetical protein AAGF12_07430 [Myxococcota bacterium]